LRNYKTNNSKREQSRFSG